MNYKLNPKMHTACAAIAAGRKRLLYNRRVSLIYAVGTAQAAHQLSPLSVFFEALEISSFVTFN